MPKLEELEVLHNSASSTSLSNYWFMWTDNTNSCHIVDYNQEDFASEKLLAMHVWFPLVDNHLELTTSKDGDTYTFDVEDTCKWAKLDFHWERPSAWRLDWTPWDGWFPEILISISCYQYKGEKPGPVGIEKLKQEFD